MIWFMLACSSMSTSDAGSIHAPLVDTGEGAEGEDTGGSETGDTGGSETGDTGADTAIEDSGLDTGGDTAIEDTASEDTAADTAEDTATADTAEDTSPPPCTGLVFTPTTVAFVVPWAYGTYITDSVTFDVVGCGTNVTAGSFCGGTGSDWIDFSMPGDSAPASAGSACSRAARTDPLLDDAGAPVEGDVATTVTLTMVAFGTWGDTSSWTQVTVDSDQGATVLHIDFD